MTYPDPTVKTFLDERFVPVKLHIEQEDLVAELAAGWTPALIVMDAEGREHRRSFGYHGPKELIAELSLGRAWAAIDRDEDDAVVERAREALEACRGDREREPEARYVSGVASYKASHDAAALKAAWLELLDRFPDSAWAKKAELVRE